MVEAAVKSADRALVLIERLGETSGEMSHAELAEALAIPKSSLTQLLKTLVARGWLDYDAAAKTYALGPAITRLARQSDAVARLPQMAGEILARLTAATSESAALNLQRGDEAEVVATVLSPQRLLSIMRLGDRAPLYATSGGKAILAFLPPRAVGAYLKRVRFQPATPQTLAAVEPLNAQLETIRALGVATSIEEFTPGVVGLACPLIDGESRVLASVNLALPASRYSPAVHAAAVDALHRAVAEFTARLERR